MNKKQKREGSSRYSLPLTLIYRINSSKQWMSYAVWVLHWYVCMSKKVFDLATVFIVPNSPYNKMCRHHNCKASIGESRLKIFKTFNLMGWMEKKIDGC